MKRLTFVLVIAFGLILGQLSAQESSRLKEEENVVSILVSRILENVDNEAKYGCEVETHPRYFPQFPKIVITKEVGEFSDEFWRLVRRRSRMGSTSVSLLRKSEQVPGAYKIHIISVTDLDRPFATIVYNHSSFNLGDVENRVGLLGLPNVPRRQGHLFTKTSRALVPTTAGLYPAMSLEKGRISLTRDSEVRKAQREYGSKDKESQDKIAEAVKSFESARLAEPLPLGFKVNSYTYYEDPVAFATGVVSQGEVVFAGSYTQYLLAKVGTGWEVLEREVVSFSDHRMATGGCIR